ncbi:AsmA family protein [Methylocapsa sp. S129]|uniref:AsmA family protein n=1 Tax=Methylocapsa sp. S129 TaxID=1641869 RepID=UPI00131A694D|nr:AsmA family protein [Methylocapsa sp. S129]
MGENGEKSPFPWFAKDEWMRLRVIWAAALFFAALALPAGFYRWPISSAFVIEETSARLSNSLGLELRRPARVHFSLLPTPTLHMVDVEVRGRDNQTILTAPEASVRLALLPLLAGNFELASAKLRQPTLLIDLDSQPFASGSVISTTMGAKSGDGGSAPLGALQIHGGLMRIVSAANKIDTIVEDVDGSFDWPKFDSSLRLDLHATWRGERLAVEASLGQPADLLKGGRSDSHLSVASSNVQIGLDGDIFDTPSRFEGSVSANVVSASALKRILGLPDASGLSDGRISLAAKVTANSQMLTLSATRLSFLEQSFEGALAFTKSAKRLAVSGTLAADELDLAPIMASAPAVIDAKGDWSLAPFNFAPLTAFDFDLRVSAARVKWRDHPLTDAAIELLSENGRLTATLAEATAYAGLLKAEIAFAPTPSSFETHASASLVNADIGALCRDFGWGAYSGQGGGEFSLQANGDSPAALARALEGKATIQLGPGVIDGVSFEEALRRSERRPIDVFNDMRMGRTVFTQAAANLTLEGGGGGTINASMAGPGVSLSLAGVLDVARRQWTARATATQTDEKGVPVAKGPHLDFDIAGPWSAPTIKPFVGGG